MFNSVAGCYLVDVITPHFQYQQPEMSADGASSLLKGETAYLQL